MDPTCHIVMALQVRSVIIVDSMDKLTGAYSRYGIIGVSLNINGAFKVTLLTCRIACSNVRTHGDTMLQLFCHYIVLARSCCNKDSVEEALVLAGWNSRAGQSRSLDSWALSVLHDAHQCGQHSEGRSTVSCQALS